MGIVHGQQIVPAGDGEMLAALARQMDVDVLISGGTHRWVEQRCNWISKLIAASKPSSLMADSSSTRVLPQAHGVGSMGETARPSQPADTSDSTPSFALLDVQGPVIVTYVYQLVDGEVCRDSNGADMRRSKSTRSNTGSRIRHEKPPPRGSLGSALAAVFPAMHRHVMRPRGGCLIDRREERIEAAFCMRCVVLRPT